MDEKPKVALRYCTTVAYHLHRILATLDPLCTLDKTYFHQLEFGSTLVCDLRGDKFSIL